MKKKTRLTAVKLQWLMMTEDERPGCQIDFAARSLSFRHHEPLKFHRHQPRFCSSVNLSGVTQAFARGLLEGIVLKWD